MMSSMIECLTLTDFRNHTTTRVTTGGRRNIIITGPNGAGKTAILEAVSLLCGDRGLRGAAPTDLARFGAGGFGVAATLADDTQLAVYYTGGDAARRAKIDGENATLADLSARLRMVWLTPREDRLFVDGATARRAFFDRLVASFNAPHAGRTARLSKLMSERAAALRRGANSHWIDALDAQIAGVAVAVADARIRYAGEINYFLAAPMVTVSGQIESMLTRGDAFALAEGAYRDYLGHNRELSGDKMLIDGPHKSDFGFFNAALGLPAHLTSTGQQKSALIDLILAHAKLVHSKTGMRPLILLDEAAAHLDADARARLFRELGAADAQVWATGLDASVFADVDDAAFVACAGGGVRNILLTGKEKHEQD